jgi:sirohydrochlorin ferrochelatase
MTGPGTPPESKLAVVLIAHGSRHDAANADAAYFARQLQLAGLATQVVPAYLELAEPSIPQAVAALIPSRPETIVLLPYFLSGGVHVKRDLAALCQQFESEHSAVHFVLAEPIGRHPLLTAVLSDRLNAALKQPRPAGDSP